MLSVLEDSANVSVDKSFNGYANSLKLDDGNTKIKIGCLDPIAYKEFLWMSKKFSPKDRPLVMELYLDKDVQAKMNKVQSIIGGDISFVENDGLVDVIFGHSKNNTDQVAFKITAVSLSPSFTSCAMDSIIFKSISNVSKDCPEGLKISVFKMGENKAWFYVETDSEVAYCQYFVSGGLNGIV